MPVHLIESLEDNAAHPIPGVGGHSAEQILAEIDMDPFPLICVHRQD